jgi:hypothetical protein
MLEVLTAVVLKIQEVWNVTQLDGYPSRQQDLLPQQHGVRLALHTFFITSAMTTGILL